MTLSPYPSRRLHAAGRMAPLYRWDPRREIEDISTRFNQVMSDFFGEPATTTRWQDWPALTPVDVEETDNAYIVDVDLPDVDPREVNVEIRGEELRITGRFQQRQRGGVMRRQNRPTGEFEYQVELPGDADADKVEATFGNGVLTVTVTKAEELTPRKIEIRAHEAPQRNQRQPQQSAQRGEQQGRQKM
ncbi:Hsp20/alpha crystallin family protein [Dactylosporangium sp. NPDC051485]|uniref:Hsp20/alpha crystallin family protein n=1 Tax=Dactylosporangium sp. NPDC051485 TaxID=3154846 RepID=UPI0034341FE1